MVEFDQIIVQEDLCLYKLKTKVGKWKLFNKLKIYRYIYSANNFQLVINFTANQ